MRIKKENREEKFSRFFCCVLKWGNHKSWVMAKLMDNNTWIID